MTRCPECGRHDDLRAELRALLATARRRSNASMYGQACASMVPYYERALSALEEGAAVWGAQLRAMSRAAAPPSVHPASERVNATGAPGDEALAKSAAGAAPDDL